MMTRVLELLSERYTTPTFKLYDTMKELDYFRVVVQRDLVEEQIFCEMEPERYSKNFCVKSSLLGIIQGAFFFCSYEGN